MKLPKTLTTVTPFSKFLALVIIVIFILGSFYIGMQYQLMHDLLVLVPQHEVGITTQPVKNAIVITVQDSGKIMTAHVGDKIILSLGKQMQWSINNTNPNILSVSPNGIFYITPPTAMYKAVSPGTVILSATGRPHCTNGQVCSMLIVEFTTTIVVK